MRSDRVTARIELANLLPCEKSALADVIGRDETVGTQAERFEPVGDHRVVRGAAVVHGNHSRDSGFAPRQARGALRLSRGGIPAFARRASAGKRDSKLREG